MEVYLSLLLMKFLILWWKIEAALLERPQPLRSNQLAQFFYKIGYPLSNRLHPLRGAGGFGGFGCYKRFTPNGMITGDKCKGVFFVIMITPALPDLQSGSQWEGICKPQFTHGHPFYSRRFNVGLGLA